MEKGLYRDAINRSYYAAFYAIKALLALEEVDFKRHKDVVAYFNRTYAVTEKVPREIGRKLAHLQQKREKSDYDDFYIASKEETVLPGLGVLFEIVWQNCSEDVKNNILQTLVNNI